MMTRELFERINGFPDQTCSVDFHFDNLRELLNVPVFWSKQVLGRRRLHKHSLTNGPEYEMGTKLREEANRYVMNCLEAMQEKPSLAHARSFSAMCEAMEL
jgi:hypothetical protein